MHAGIIGQELGTRHPQIAIWELPPVYSAWCITSHFALLLSFLVYKGNTHLPYSKDFTRLFTVTIMFIYGATETLATI